MKRRQALLGIVSLGIPLSTVRLVTAQTSSKMPLVGMLDGGERLAWWAAFRQHLRELGYIEGKNISIEGRYARGKSEHLPALAEEMVRLKADVIVTSSVAAAVAAKRATDTIPIVTATGSGHVSHGLAMSLAKPGGNVTGLSSVASDLTTKRLELLREIKPGLSRLAVVWHRDDVGSVTQVHDLQSEARGLKMALHNLGIRKAQDLIDAFAAGVQNRAEAFFIVLSPLIYAERKTIAALAIKHRLPTMSGASELVEAGAFVSYGTSYTDLHRRAAIYVDKILKGAKPGDLPIEEPTTFDLVINVRTAQAIGFQVPQTVMLRATRVVD